jgi:hypothetical protein
LEKYAWIDKIKDGYMCRLCQKFGIKPKYKPVVWVTVPLALSSSRKLYEKAEKHATSAGHQASAAASKMEGQAVKPYNMEY